MASMSEGSSTKDTCHTKTATKQDAKARQAPGLIQEQPKHPSFLLARHEGSEWLLNPLQDQANMKIYSRKLFYCGVFFAHWVLVASVTVLKVLHELYF